MHTRYVPITAEVAIMSRKDKDVQRARRIERFDKPRKPQAKTGVLSSRIERRRPDDVISSGQDLSKWVKVKEWRVGEEVLVLVLVVNADQRSDGNC